MGLESLLRGVVSRSQPSPVGESQRSTARLGRYGELYVSALGRKQHLLADEGFYFVANNAQTAITGQTDTAFTATHPTLMVVNTDSPGNPTAKRIYLDYAYFLNGGTAFTNATSNTGVFGAVVLDTAARYTSGGTEISSLIVGANIDGPARSSIAKVYCGAIVASASGSTARMVVGQRLLRMPVSATALSLANVDEFFMNFGGVESSVPPAQATSAASATLEANKVARALSLPPLVIGPGQSVLIYLFAVAGGAVTAGNLLPEVAWWER